MRRKLLIVVGIIAALAIVAGVLLVFVLPAADTSQAAAIDHVSDQADSGTTEVLAQQDWGDGQLVLVGYERRGVRRLGLAFSTESFLGWKVTSYTEKSVEPDDVVVGSLLVASSLGGEGQPAWSAAMGELIDKRIDRAEVKWSSGPTSFGPRTGDAYLVLQRGTLRALEIRYLAKDGSEIAKVPVSSN